MHVHVVIPLMPSMARRRSRIVPIGSMGVRLLRGICNRLRHESLKKVVGDEGFLSVAMVDC